MKAFTINGFAATVTGLAMALGFVTTARADLVIEQTGPPGISHSWDVPFFAAGVTFDTITGTVSTPVFEVPGLTAGGWTPSGNASTASINGPATSSLLFTAHFLNTPGTTPPFFLDFTVFNQNALVGQTVLEWTGSEFDVVPEPSTILAGVLLVLPFGATALRTLRKSRKA